MLSFPALDVAIGLVFVYFILALICSAINEAIATAGKWRAHDLERGIVELLRDPAKHGAEAVAAVEALRRHPLINPLIDPARKAGATGAAHAAWPSYIPSRTFASALLGLSPKVVAAGEKLPGALRDIETSIGRIPSKPVQEALSSLLHSAQGDAVAFRISVEQWYDDHMERVSGWYRRRVQKVLFVVAILLAVTINADSLQIAKRLWMEPSVRAALVGQAAKANNDAPAQLSKLPVPLGWHLASERHDPQGFPFYERPSMAWALLSKLIGLLLTAIALTLGAPFWFDTLSKIARLRNSGAPPPASDAVRHGEGEEKRRGGGHPPRG